MKFIIADPTEERHLPSDVVAATTFVKGLETLTGADFIITPSKVPVTENTLRVHAAKGLCVQRKDISDLVSSFQSNDGRLWRQLVRLKMLSALPWLLIIGDLKAANRVDNNGSQEFKAVVDGRESGINYFAVSGAIDSWQEHGGYYSWISRPGLLLPWCERKYRRLVAKESAGGWRPTLLKRGVVKPLELLTEVESTLCTLPGLGPERARAVYEEARKVWDRPTVVDCMRVLRDNKVDGVGEKIKSSALKYFGWTGEQK